MIEIKNTKRYDLEDRTCEFAKRVRVFVKKLPRTVGNIEDVKQLIRSSGSLAANYIEANESLSKKDFIMRIKISRKETRERSLWLDLIDIGGNTELEKERRLLLQESTELRKIFGAILEKSK